MIEALYVTYRPVKSHAIGVSVTHLSTTSRSHAKKKKSHATFQIFKLKFCQFSHANKKNWFGESLSCAAKLNLKSRSYLFPKNTSIRFSFTCAAKCQSRFKKEWGKLYPISSVSNSPGKVRCTVCYHILSCSHQGEADVKRHIQGAIHQKKLKSLKSMKTLSSFGFRPNDDSIWEQVCKLSYAAVRTYLKYNNYPLITFLYLFYELFYV